ncbi:MAG: extracellular solute-binding protein [Bradyrhizobiaceae bacterium]|nr:extracellular solute-binding protein [Bradyrhizobiaceae bacterium]
MTWDHPRGVAPLDASIPLFQAVHPEVDIKWDRRSLREFGEAPIGTYAQQYDLIIIDHPFVGFAAKHGPLADLSSHVDPDRQAIFACESVGPSWESYWYQGKLWALPIDAAAQVAACRPDLLDRVGSTFPSTFDEVIALGFRLRRSGWWIGTPLFPTDAISMLFTLAANLGEPVGASESKFLSAAIGREVMMRFRTLVALSHPLSLKMNPIKIYDLMSESDEIAYCPYAFGYSNYSRRDRRRRLQFGNIPSAGRCGVAGSILGGTGIAVSSRTAHFDLAVEYAFFLTESSFQRSHYYASGGQPAARSAWLDASINEHSNFFFRNTIKTLDAAYLRPRFDGFVPFYEQAGERIVAMLQNNLSENDLLSWLNEAYDKAREQGTQPKT